MRNRTILRILSTFACAVSLQASIITNGDFQTGNLSSWTTYTTAGGGTLGSGFPTVVSFDTTGSGASLAAEFDVGNVSTYGTPSGGGISQNIIAPSTAFYQFSAAIASQDDVAGLVNGDPGTFSLIVDGNTIATTQLVGFFNPFEIVRGSLSGGTTLAAGSHVLSVQITRNYIAGDTITPNEFVDNISASTSAAPEPGTLSTMATMAAGAALLALGRRRVNRLQSHRVS